MNNYQDWAHLVAKKLKGEADVLAAIDKDELDDAAATEVFVRTVLTPFLPENYGVGAGRVIDAFGNRSEYMDVVIYNRSFPRIGLRGTQSDYLYESVLATFAIRAKYVRKTFFESMDACASMARLVTNVDKTVLVQLARKNGLKPGPNKTFVHEDPLRTARFELIGSPPAFMFGFTGFKTSYRQLQENVELWIKQRTETEADLPMRALPAVIATQGCYAWRNAAPLALSNREMLGIGNDDAPVRLIILQLLYLLNRRLNVTTDGYGMKPNLSSYLSQFKPPRFELGIGDVDKLVSRRLADGQKASAEQSKRIKPAKDHAEKSKPEKARKPARAKAGEKAEETKASTSEDAKASKSEDAKASKSEDTKASKPDPVKAGSKDSAAPKPSVKEADEAPVSKPEEASSGVFDKPSPFASAPPPAEDKKEAASPAPRRPVATLGSAPIPGVSDTGDIPSLEAEGLPTPDLDPEPEEPEEPSRPPVAPLGSAPIPQAKPAVDVTPPKPPVDIELTGDIEIPGDDKEADFESTMVITPNKEADNAGKQDDIESTMVMSESKQDEFESTVISAPGGDDPPDFESTVVITPDASLSKKIAENSTDAFIDRVKNQLSGADKKSGDKDEPFVNTTPV